MQGLPLKGSAECAAAQEAWLQAQAPFPPSQLFAGCTEWGTGEGNRREILERLLNGLLERTNSKK